MSQKISLLIVIVLTSVLSVAQQIPLEINSGNMVAGVTSDVKFSINSTEKNTVHFPLNIFTSLDGCETIGEVASAQKPGGVIEYKRELLNKASGLKCILTERFKPGEDGFHCEIEVRGSGDPWTTAITTGVHYRPGGETRIWAPWGDPRISRECFSNNGISDTGSLTLGQNWTDPLLARKFFNDTLFYGAPYFRYDKPGVAFIPFQWDLFCIPMVSILERNADKGLSIILNPREDLLDLTMKVSEDGEILFSRLFNRISCNNILKFSFDIVIHEADWRGGLRWMSSAYPEYFDPVNPAAAVMAGTGGYSDSDVDFDAAKMKKMAFSVNWRASFDFPYMGMFIPPVGSNETWTRFGGRPTSVSNMEAYAGKMKNLGFHVLSYFNVTEFGAKMKYPPDPVSTTDESELWKCANDFLAAKLSGALLHVPQRVSQEQLGFYGKTRRGGAYFTWEDGVVMDCGDPGYKEFLLDQAQKHIELIPSAEGICIDRLDWLRMYNEERDDSISWYVDRPARSLVTSWKNLMKDLSPMMHKNDKVIFVNNHDKRLDLLKGVDGIFDEFTYAGVPLNLTAFLCINKPALGWTADNKPIKSEGCDNFFQKYLYLGVYPMAPFPGNDHSIHPDDWTDRQYLDYGPLLSLMRGRKWALEPHCVEVVEGSAKVNLFKVEAGYVIPVVFGATAKSVTILVRNVPGLKNSRCRAIYPGSEGEVHLDSEEFSGSLKIQVPLVRGCAMVRIDN